MRDDRYRVAAYITAYEDAGALSVCLSALQQQSYTIEQILIVDNSRNPLPLDSHSVCDLQVIHRPENIGIAAGIQWAIDRCLSEGYDFLWMFDQDSQPAPDCLEWLIKSYVAMASDRYLIGIIAPHAIDARTGATVEPALFLGDRFKGYKAPSATEPFECDAPITSGSLLWLKTINQVAPPDSRLFIDGIDLDYGFRLRQAGFHNLIVPTSTMWHRFGEPIAIRFAGKKKTIQLYSALRHYYICRNHTYLEFGYSQGYSRSICALRRIRYAIVQSILILLFDPQLKFKKAIACLLGTYDGFRGNLARLAPR